MLFMRLYREGDSFPEINPDPKNGLYFIALDGEKPYRVRPLEDDPGRHPD